MVTLVGVVAIVAVCAGVVFVSFTWPNRTQTTLQPSGKLKKLVEQGIRGNRGAD
ncbi:hypothetical protein [Nocardia sp. alder85J]|uniref:hypothetical protein n=1 Tax=Nocardia sp. alder85J TaxID=2862949 RepID=UPI001CD566A5|nr:hypothetical protein [Nocardia sp. alder85J]MCX4093588.1 hypothetical protein [Nocardia sp. alder85J]